MSMTIEEIKARLFAVFFGDLAPHAIEADEIIDSIAAIRTEGYNQGWDDAMEDAQDED